MCTCNESCKVSEVVYEDGVIVTVCSECGDCDISPIEYSDEELAILNQ